MNTKRVSTYCDTVIPFSSDVADLIDSSDYLNEYDIDALTKHSNPPPKIKSSDNSSDYPLSYSPVSIPPSASDSSLDSRIKQSNLKGDEIHRLLNRCQLNELKKITKPLKLLRQNCKTEKDFWLLLHNKNAQDLTPLERRSDLESFLKHHKLFPKGKYSS